MIRQRTIHILVVLACAGVPVPLSALASPGPPAPAVDLDLDVQAQLQLDEEQLVVQVEYRPRANQAATVDLDRQPLLLPLVAPVVGAGARAVVLDHGSVPRAAQGMVVNVDSGLRVERRGGGVWVLGKLSQTSNALITLQYPIKSGEDEITLGLRGTGARTSLMVALASGAPARPRIAFDRPARVSRFEEGRDRLVGGSLARPLKPGEVVRFTIQDLPAAPTITHRWLTALSVLLTVGAWALWWSRRAAGRVSAVPAGSGGASA